jgi:hypothetical protein
MEPSERLPGLMLTLLALLLGLTVCVMWWQFAALVACAIFAFCLMD